jgi:hypothetical protein
MLYLFEIGCVRNGAQSCEVHMNRYLDPEFTLQTSSKYEADICSAYQ